MRLTISQSWLLVLTAFLFVPSTIRPAYSAEDLPKIQTNCKIDDTQIPPLLLSIRLPPFASLVASDQAAQSKKIEALIQAKQWDQAFQEFQRGSSWVQDQTIRPLLVALVQSNETVRASQFVIEKFPPQSKKRAQGIGVIAAELTNRNQFPDAIALLKNLPRTSEYLSDALVPIVGALTSTNQIRNIPEVMALFPVSDQKKWTLWTDIGEQIPFEPEQAKEVAGMIEGHYLRSVTLKNMATYWLPAGRRSFLKAWNITNEIEDCRIRTEAFLQAFEELKTSGLSKTQQEQALDQLEPLIAVLDKSRRDQSDQINFRLSLASLNIRNERKPQGIRLLEQVSQDLKQHRSEMFRAMTLLKLATQYQSIPNQRVAIQMLDAAVTATHAAYKQEIAPSFNRLPLVIPPAQWRDETLATIAERYRSLNQIQKAAAIERTLPKRRRFAVPAPLPLAPSQRSISVPKIQPLRLSPSLRPLPRIQPIPSNRVLMEKR